MEEYAATDKGLLSVKTFFTSEVIENQTKNEKDEDAFVLVTRMKMR